jgi:hypothetical protein
MDIEKLLTAKELAPHLGDVEEKQIKRWRRDSEGSLAAQDLLSIFEVITPARLVIASLAAAVEPIGESTTAPVRA